ncbi:hypothetical protein K9M41_04635 [Candidatus Gracilibacteria bacterium]|nr:hypothetical protein [Candidatus Gracilibacteria bacterium]
MIFNFNLMEAEKILYSVNTDRRAGDRRGIGEAEKDNDEIQEDNRMDDRRNGDRRAENVDMDEREDRRGARIRAEVVNLLDVSTSRKTVDVSVEAQVAALNVLNLKTSDRVKGKLE